ncbi:ATP-binding cassette domain-containing protein [Arachnia propionica]|uniref:ATP-binding cassette domain-containing protein n=1 Tax=Arachnia propionica TaxID=1750 RepID=UPI0021AB189A|nr:ATP-binding cassette domain-containing protein [Arachnia propionica]
MRTFGNVAALQRADFDVRPGEVSALIGDNGAGKSTLVRILAGADAPDAGTLLFEGLPITLANPTQARERGVETVFQDLALANHLNPVENMFLGREVMRRGWLGRLGFMQRSVMRQQGIEAFEDLGATVRDFGKPVAGMSGGQRQAIAVARAAAWASKVIFLDEPTAALGVVQTKGVLDLIRRIRDKGVGVVLISHSMPEVLVRSIGFGRVLGVPVLVIIAAVVVTVGIVLLRHTRFGLHTEAIGSNPEAGRRVGINVDRQLIKVYMFAGFLAGVAGLLNLAFYRSTTIAGHSLTNLDVIAGVVIGGTSLFGGFGTVFGTVIGLLIPATLRNGFVILGVQPYWQQVVVGAFLVAAVYLGQQRRAAASRGQDQRGLLARLLSTNRKEK